MKIILGITGSISAYKGIEISRTFQKKGHLVHVILTRSATRFINELTFETFSPGKVYSDMFAKHQDPLLHINLSKECDLMLIAPASANIIGKMANGIADDLLSTTYIAFYKKVVIAPAMNSYMLDHSAVQDNLLKLRSRQAYIIEPEKGSLACSDNGKGRLPSAESIYRECIRIGNAK